LQANFTEESNQNSKCQSLIFDNDPKKQLSP